MYYLKKNLLISYNRFLTIITALLIFIPSLYSANYYVKTNGNNIGHDGLSWGQAWKTISHAASNVGAGNTIFVSNGIYRGTVRVQSNGAPGNYITFQSYNPYQAIITNGSVNNCFYLSNKSYIKIREFVLKKNYRGISLHGSSSNNYIIKNSIFSNYNYGIIMFSNTVKNNFIISNTIFATNQNSGIRNNGGFGNVIQYNTIYKNRWFGIYLTLGAKNNYISKNTIYSNSGYGIGIDYGANNNKVFTNLIYGTQLPVGRGIQCDDVTNNIIMSNQVFNNYNYSIVIGATSHLNLIKHNFFYNWTTNYNVLIDGTGSQEVYSNKIYGSSSGITIWNGKNKIHNNIIQYGTNGISIQPSPSYSNQIYNNLIFSNSRYGIFINGTGFNIIQRNNIFDNKWIGVYLYAASNNYIVNNMIYSNALNGDAGIKLMALTARNNYIISNRIYGQKGTVFGGGIFIYNANKNKIYKNLINNNNQYGTYIADSGTITTNDIINNTIYQSILSGIRFANNSSGYIYNNIILSNSNYGIERTSSGIVVAGYNNLYGNSSGVTNGGIIWGQANTLLDPMLETTTSFTITSTNSPSVDSGTNYWGPGYTGNGWDMGWKESSWITTGPTTPSTNTNILTTYLEERRFKNNIIKFCQGEIVTYQHLFQNNNEMEALIFDMLGEIIKKFTKVSGLPGDIKTIHWDGKDDNGKCCGPGYYILYIKPDNKKYKIIIY